MNIRKVSKTFTEGGGGGYNLAAKGTESMPPLKSLKIAYTSLIMAVEPPIVTEKAMTPL